MKTIVVSTVLAVLALLAIARPAAAHALGAECKVKGDKVEVEAYFDDDTAARDAKVTVHNADKKTVAEGRTDKDGRWSFAKPPAGSYVVLVDAGSAHVTKVKITIPAELKPAPATAAVTADDFDCCKEPVAPAVVSDGPTREEFTRFPWLKVAIGLGAIAVMSLALWFSRLRARASSSTPPIDPSPLS